MPSIVEFSAPSGLALGIELYPYGSDTIDNPGGDDAVEYDERKGLYAAAVEESLIGWHHVIIKSGVKTTGTLDVFIIDGAICRAHDRPQMIDTSAVHSSVIAAIQSGLATTLDLSSITDLFEADRYIDTSVTPWALVLIKRGTGVPGVGVELLRQRLFKETGEAVMSIDHFVGRSIQ